MNFFPLLDDLGILFLVCTKNLLYELIKSRSSGFWGLILFSLFFELIRLYYIPIICVCMCFRAFGIGDSFILKSDINALYLYLFTDFLLEWISSVENNLNLFSFSNFSLLQFCFQILEELLRWCCFLSSFRIRLNGRKDLRRSDYWWSFRRPRLLGEDNQVTGLPRWGENPASEFLSWNETVPV